MRHEEKRDQHGRNEVRGPLQPRSDPDTQAIALIKGVEEISRADDVEHPHQNRTQPTAQRRLTRGNPRFRWLPPPFRRVAKNWMLSRRIAGCFASERWMDSFELVDAFDRNQWWICVGILSLAPQRSSIRFSQ